MEGVTERTPGKDVWESHLSLTAVSTSLLLLHLAGKGSPRTTLLLCRTVLCMFWFCGGVTQ